MYFLSLIQVFSLNVFYNALIFFTTHSSCKNLICNWKIHLKDDDNAKNSVEMNFLGAFFGPP
jgi:hypothetical protein